MKQNFYKCISLDFEINKSSFKSVFIVIFYRLSSYFSQNESNIIRVMGVPIRIAYKLIVEFFMGIELPDKTISGC